MLTYNSLIYLPTSLADPFIPSHNSSIFLSSCFTHYYFLFSYPSLPLPKPIKSLFLTPHILSFSPPLLHLSPFPSSSFTYFSICCNTFFFHLLSPYFLTSPPHSLISYPSLPLWYPLTPSSLTHPLSTSHPALPPPRCCSVPTLTWSTPLRKGTQPCSGLCATRMLRWCSCWWTRKPRWTWWTRRATQRCTSPWEGGPRWVIKGVWKDEKVNIRWEKRWKCIAYDTKMRMRVWTVMENGGKVLNCWMK